MTEKKQIQKNGNDDETNELNFTDFKASYIYHNINQYSINFSYSNHVSKSIQSN